MSSPHEGGSAADVGKSAGMGESKTFSPSLLMSYTLLHIATWESDLGMGLPYTSHQNENT